MLDLKLGTGRDVFCDATSRDKFGFDWFKVNNVF